MPHETRFKDGTLIDPMSAIDYAEGCNNEGNEEDTFRSWSYIQGTRICVGLQGFYGRTCKNLIDQGIMDIDGTLDWNKVTALIEDSDE